LAYCRQASRLEVIPAAGHFTWLDAPDVFWPLVIDFVARVNEPAPA
jgi:pimeloyl-ACP methyl ester carboxylesterase